MRPGSRSWSEIAWVGLMVLGVLGLTFALQARSTEEWDGAVYYDMARQVAAGQWPVHAAGPFVFRIGQPWLAAHLSPSDLTRGFLWISVPAIVLQALCFYAVIARYIERRWVRLLCAALFLGQFHGLARFIPFRPNMTDPPGALAIFAGLLLVEKWRESRNAAWLVSLSVLVFVGAFFRESVLIPALASPFAFSPLRFDTAAPVRWRWPKLDRARIAWLALLPLLAWLLGTLVDRRIVVVENTGEMWTNLLRNARGKLPPTLLLAYGLTFGVLGFLPLYAYRSTLAFLREHQHHAVALLVALSLAFIGGSDTERLAYWGAPALFVMLGRLLDQRDFRSQAGWLVPLLLLHALGQRWLWLLPQTGGGGGVPILTMLGSHVAYEDLWSSHMRRVIRLVLSVEYGALAAAMFYVLHRRGVTFEPPSAAA